jgi:PTH1 family peptidyl-tRNA hydrolase
MDHTLIIGLGNPDPALEETYHNAGALAVQWIAEHQGSTDGAVRFRRYEELFTYARIQNTILVRPLVFMNESGDAVREAMHVFDVTPESIVIIHDDSDIPMGEFRRTEGGGSAGHNGIQSIIDHLGTEDFARIRIGIREKDETHRKKAGDFVLSPISTDDKKILEEVFQKISDVLEVG